MSEILSAGVPRKSVLVSRCQWKARRGRQVNETGKNESGSAISRDHALHAGFYVWFARLRVFARHGAEHAVKPKPSAFDSLILPRMPSYHGR